jgi:cell division septation protein DedD
MKKGLSQNAQFALVGVGFLLALLLGYFLLISPQRSSIGDLQKQIASTENAIVAARAETAKAKHAPKIQVADLFRLTKAMPDRVDQADMVLELSQTAEQSGISFDSIKPGVPVVESGYQAIPVELIFNGNYYALSDFLFRLRNLVDVHRGALDATGRLFTIDKISFSEGFPKFPEISAQLNVVAFVYGTSTPAPVPAVTTTSATTTSTTTSPTTTAPSASAAPANPGGTG